MCRTGLTSLLILAILSSGTMTWRGLGQDAQSSNLDPLVTFLSQTTDPTIQRDVLRGMVDALNGVPSRSMPTGWAALEERFEKSESAEVRSLALNLAVKFGSLKARQSLRKIALSETHSQVERQDAIATLIASSDEALVDTLLQLVSHATFRAQAIRGLGQAADSRIPPVLIALYPQLNLEEKRDVLNTLSGRSVFATALLKAVADKIIPSRDLTASLIRQLRNLKSEPVDTQLELVWGRYREPGQDKLAEIARYRQIYRAGGSKAGNASQGRSIFVRTCQQCHSLFGIGGTIGPDITGSDRANLAYLLENIIDPNGVIPNEYQTSTVETVDDRVLTGIITEQNAASLTVVTANETVTLPRNDVFEIQKSSLSMMPEGLLTALTDQEVRDLLYYLRQPAQAPLIASGDTINLFFNGTDLSGWDGDPDLWSVEGGTIIGQTKEGLDHNEFLLSEMLLDDFRLTFEVKLTPNSENSGIQFRSQPAENREVKGYQADVGAGWWGKLYEELGRGLLWDKPGDAHVRVDDWNQYEILATGHRIQTAINGKPCVDLNDPEGDLQGRIAFQIHSGGPMSVRFRNLQLELAPKSSALNSVKN